MFFGSGNLVFPVACGVAAGQKFIYSALGLIITAILIPLLGLMSALVSSKPQKAYFEQLGPRTGFFIIMIILALIGPFGVCARCVLVAFGGVQLLIPELKLWMFSLFFCVITAAVLLRDKRAVTTIGKYLTPILLIGIVTVFLLSFRDAPYMSCHEIPIYEAFSYGFLQGYQTMDLMGALFFAFTIREFFETQHADLTYYEMRAYKFWAALMGIGLLAIIYFMLVYLGARYNDVLSHIPPEKLIVSIGELVMGKYSGVVVTGIVFLACLTTIIVLTKLSADFLRIRIVKERISFSYSVIIICAITFCISLLGFERLSAGLGFILEFLYPALVAFAGFSLFAKITNVNLIRFAFWITFLMGLGTYFYPLVRG